MYLVSQAVNFGAVSLLTLYSRGVDLFLHSCINPFVAPVGRNIICNRIIDRIPPTIITFNVFTFKLDRSL